MTQTSSNSLRYVVTVCAADFQDKEPNIGLLFVDRERLVKAPTEEDIANILTHDDLEAVFGPRYWGAAFCWILQSGRSWVRDEAPRQHGVFVSTNNVLFDKAGLVEHTYYLRNGELLTKVSTDDAHNKCIRLMKLMGCEKCSLKGYECIQGNIPDAVPVVAIKDRVWGDPNQLRLPIVSFERVLPDHAAGRIFGEDYWDKLDERVIDYDDWKDLKYRNWRSVIAGHQLISPLATNPDAPAPTAKSVRRMCHHDFRDVESARDAISDRSRAAAETRNRIRTECSKCYFGGKTYGHPRKPTPCCRWRVRVCEHGAWTEERLVDYTLEKFARVLEDTPFDLESMWRVAYVSGVFFKKKSEHTGRPRQWVICRITKGYRYSSEGKLEVIASRTARDARGPMVSLTSPQEVRDFLSPEVQELWDNPKPMDREAFAIWLHLAITTCGRSYSYYFSTDKCCGFGSVSPSLGWVGLCSYGVKRCLWLSREERETTFSSLQEVFNHYEDLLLFHIREEENETKPHLYAHVR